MTSLEKTKSEIREKRGECQFCGVTNDQHTEEYGRQLHIHHIIPSSSGGGHSKDNLIPVCESCHKTLEHTQGKALARLSERQVDKKVVDELRESRDGLVSRIHELERLVRNPAFYRALFTNERVNIEVVASNLGTDVTATSEHDSAISAYEGGMSSIRRTSVSVSEEDVNKWVRTLRVENRLRAMLESDYGGYLPPNVQEEKQSLKGARE